MIYVMVVPHILQIAFVKLARKILVLKLKYWCLIFVVAWKKP